jgi:hypothetical protein
MHVHKHTRRTALCPDSTEAAAAAPPPATDFWVRSERRRAVRNERRLCLEDAVRKRELELRRHQLLDVRPAHVRRLLDLDDAEDLRA